MKKVSSLKKNIKKIKGSLIMGIILAMSITMFGCDINKKIGKTEKESNKQTYAMGTVVSLKVYGEKAEENIEEAIKLLGNIEEKMSVNKENSEVNRLNSSAGNKSEKVSKETYYVIKKAIEYSKLSEGAFDITVEPLVKLWGIGTDKARIPSKEEIEKAKELINYKNIEINEDGQIYLKKSGMKIDLGAIAKGYGADEIKSMLIKNGVKSAFINIGGNVNLLGSKTDGSPWKIGVQNPLKDKGEYLGILTTEDKSIVTSGNYERYFEKDGKRYHHIFDVKTGYPADKGLISTTIVSDKSIDGDALSTTTYVLGLEKAIKLVESQKGVDAIFVTKDKKIYVTSGVKDKFKLTDKEFQYVN
ncbi:FAD:protein FMN transferase [Haloimpatiens lingqiaonensis]|uniref:FAD:protein FMN transferase n=1 Tax=Haloimpatiens lingqiaonensis TaxID=1380675 RepID=UPI001FA9740A|nr:FAD:protein FMN transferase [Haloimpatiens lingqiaonensis]